MRTGNVSGFSIAFGLLVAALLVEWARIEMLQAKRERVSRNNRAAAAVRQGTTASLQRVAP